MAEATAGDRRIKEIELSMMLAQIAEQRGQPDKGIRYLQQAVVPQRPEKCSGSWPRAKPHLRMRTEPAATSLRRFVRDGGCRQHDGRRQPLLASRASSQTCRHTCRARSCRGGEPPLRSGHRHHRRDHGERAQPRGSGTPRRRQEPDLRGTLPSGRRPSQRSRQSVRRHRAGAWACRNRCPADASLRCSVERARRRYSGADNRAVAAALDARPGGGGAATAPRSTVGGRTTIKTAERWVSRRPPVGGQRTSAKALQQALVNDQLLLEYVLTEPQSYCLVLSRTRIRIAELPSKGQIEAVVDRFTQDLKSGKSSSPTVSTDLYDAILASIPESETARRVFVVPDGKLHLLAFDALLDRHGPESRTFRRPLGQCLRLASDDAASDAPPRALMGGWRRPLRSDVPIRQAGCSGTIRWDARTA